MNKDLILKKEDIVTYKIKNGRGITNVADILNGQSISVYEKTFGHQVIKVERPVKYETIYEIKEILDEKEKEYLSNVIRPFRDRVEFIIKNGFSDEEYIDIHLGEEFISFPVFKKHTMYERMEINKRYTIEELGL